MKRNATKKMSRNVIVDSAEALLNPWRIWSTTRIDSVVVAAAAAAAGEDGRQVVDAQHVQGAEQHRDHQRRPDQRQGDPGEPLPRAGAVDPGRLVDVGGIICRPARISSAMNGVVFQTSAMMIANRAGHVSPVHRISVCSERVRDAVEGEDEEPQLGGHRGRDRPRDQDRRRGRSPRPLKSGS